MLKGMELRTVRRARGRCRPRDARTAVQPPTNALTLPEVAEFITRTPDDRTRLRLFFEFCRGADEAGPAAVSLVDTEPHLTGLQRFDALLAAIAEHVTSRFGVPGPPWAENTNRFLTSPWWVSPLPSARVQALAGFRRRGIYLDGRDLGQDGAAPMHRPGVD